MRRKNNLQNIDKYDKIKLMITPENPFSHADDHDGGPYDALYDPSQADLDNALHDKLLTLQKSLEMQRPADFRTREFHFYDDNLPEWEALPNSVLELVNDGNRLESLTIACAATPDRDASAVSYELTFGFDNDGEETELLILRPHYYIQTPDSSDIAVVSDGDDEADDYSGDFDDVRSVRDFAPATPEELNKLFESFLFFEDADNGTHGFDYRHADLSFLIKMLGPIADGTTGKDMYTLTSDNVPAGDVTFYLHGGTTVAFHIMQTRFSDAPDTYASAIDEVEIETSRYHDGDDSTAIFRHRLTGTDFSTSALDYDSARLETILAFIDSQTVSQN